jgi:hypothetical protein
MGCQLLAGGQRGTSATPGKRPTVFDPGGITDLRIWHPVRDAISLFIHTGGVVAKLLNHRLIAVKPSGFKWKKQNREWFDDARHKLTNNEFEVEATTNTDLLHDSAVQ